MSQARVSFSKGEAYVTYDPKRVTADKMIAAIDRVGFEAELLAGESLLSSD